MYIQVLTYTMEDGITSTDVRQEGITKTLIIELINRLIKQEVGVANLSLMSSSD